MFEKIKDVVGDFIRIGVADKKDVEKLVKEIQKALIQADVDIKLVLEFSKKVKKEALKEDLPKGLTRKEHIIKIVYDNLVEILGKEKRPVKIGKQKILLLGLYGAGKTTTSLKLAYFFKKRGLKTCILGCDIHRPAALEQLKQGAEKIGVDVFGKKAENVEDVVKAFKDKIDAYDVVIIDSAGRSAMDEELVEELKYLCKELEPEERFLVIPADIGQAARNQAKLFNDAVNITGAIITKADSTAKGGGAISACYEAKAPVVFLGTGEKVEDLEEYDPVRFVSRILGMGDLQTLLEKAKEVMDEEEAKKIIKGDFNLIEFYNQIESINKMGSLRKILEMLPLPGIKIPKDMIEVQEEKMKKWKYMIDSMTKEERENPEIIDSSRIERIARGSGTKPEEVRELLKVYKQMKQMMKKFNSKRLLKRGLKNFPVNF